MKKALLSYVILFLLLSFVRNVNAQTNYSFPISTIISAGSAGVRLPNGTIVRADKVTTGIGAHSAASGTSNPDAMGGTFTGTSFLPAYVGSTVRESFTIIETSNTDNVNNGVSLNCNRSIGFRIYFDRPTVKISFLALDIDGTNTSPGNAEWLTGFAFNGNTYVPYDQVIVTTMDPMAVAPITVNTTAPHNWRTLITNTINATAAGNLPVSMQIQRAAGGGITPDDQRGQVVFNPSDPNAPVTDFYVLWGLWQVPAGSNTQASGLSPVVVRVSPDFGDAPDTYKTLLASAGPSHGVVGTLGFGVNNNTKADGTPSTNADTDPDDDGIASVPVLANTRSLSQIIPTYSLTSTFFNSVGFAANYVAWVDWNNNGVFEASEAQTATTAAGTTTGTVNFTWNNVTLSGTGGRANTYARIRVTTEAITTADAGGAFKDGEVEDYLVPFAIPLPLNLLSFSGKIENGHATLNWKTENENNTAGFEIQFSSNGSDFSREGYVNGVGSGNNTYAFTDTRTVQQANYYRLKMMDMDGRSTYSSIIVLRTKPGKNIELKISPNPVTSVLNINIAYAEPLSLNIYDLKGQLVKKIETQASNFITIDCSALKGGSYYLKAVNRYGETQIIQFLKNNF